VPKNRLPRHPLEVIFSDLSVAISQISSLFARMKGFSMDKDNERWIKIASSRDSQSLLEAIFIHRSS
jgi:hypothetical protein